MNASAPPRPFSRYPLLVLGLAFALGILFGHLFGLGLITAGLACYLASVFALLFRNNATIATALVALVFAFAGSLSLSIENASIRPERIRNLYDFGMISSHSPVEIEGVLDGTPEAAADGEFLTVRAEKLWSAGRELTVAGKVRFFVVSPKSVHPSNLKYGSRIRVACRLQRQDEFLNPGVVSRREILDRMQIDAVASIKSPLLIEHIADESVFLPLAWVYDQRAKLIDRFREHLSPQAAGVMIASLLGNKYFLDRETADLFREGGTFHILVISGLQITFISGLLLFAVRQFTRNRWLQFVITATMMWTYTLAVAADIPVVRAAVMVTILLYSYATYRTGNLVNSLGFCGLVLLVWRPSDLFNPSFQLTFVSVAAIVAFAFPLIQKLRAIGKWTPTPATPFPPNVPSWLSRFCESLFWNPRAWEIESKRQIWSARLFKEPNARGAAYALRQKTVRYIFEGLLVSFVVQLWLLPFTVVYFHRVSFVSIFLNLWVGIFIAMQSFAAVAGALVVGLSAALGSSFFFIAEIANSVMLAAPKLLVEGDAAGFRLPAYTQLGRAIYLIYCVPIVVFTIALWRWDAFALQKPSCLRRRLIAVIGTVSLVILTAIIVSHPFVGASSDGRLTIDFLDVGQGDSALITFPDGRTMLVDAGGRGDYRDDEQAGEQKVERDAINIGESVVSPVLWAKGYSRIDHILVTHADADHAQGLIDIAKNFEIGSGLFAQSGTAGLAALREILLQRGVEAEIAARGDVFIFGDVRVEVLSPPAEGFAGASENDNSIVVRIVYGTRSLLLTGDIESPAEMSLIATYPDLNADVVKVAHHGSRSSSTQEFVDAVQAEIAVIPVGLRSRHGHPHREVVERWQASGARVMTTGSRGMITISTDGSDLDVKTFLP